MRYDPGLWVFHERRDHYRAFATQMLKYGRGRGQVFVPAPRETRWIIPPCHWSYLAAVVAGATLTAAGQPVGPWS